MFVVVFIVAVVVIVVVCVVVVTENYECVIIGGDDLANGCLS